MTWKFACSATETSPWVDGAKEFARIVGEKTGGAITVQYYPADQLTAGSQTDGIQALMDGTTELSMHSNLIWSSFDQRFNVVSLPFLFDSVEEADAALDGAGGEALGEILESDLQRASAGHRRERLPSHHQQQAPHSSPWLT